jgi:hypothetical protein
MRSGAVARSRMEGQTSLIKDAVWYSGECGKVVALRKFSAVHEKSL